MFTWWNENIEFLSKFQRHSTLTYKWSSGYSISFFFFSTKRTKILLTMKVRSCYRTMHVSIHAHSEVCVSLRSPVRCTCCWWLSFASCCTSFLKRSEWQRTRVGNVLCVSEATQGGLLWSGFKLTCGFHWVGLAWQPIPMATSCPTNPHYQSGCSFLRSRRCRRSCRRSHLWRTRADVRQKLYLNPEAVKT